MRVLWVTPHYPDPQGSGGTVHQFELMRFAARHHDITVVTTDWSMRRGALDAVRHLGVKTRAVPWPMDVRPRTRAGRLIELVRSRVPSAVQAVYHRRLGPLRDAVVAEHRSRPVDLVCVIMGDLASVVGAIDAPTALLLFDVYWRQTDLVRARRLSPRELRFRLERRNALRWEKKWYPQAEGIACVSEVDAVLVSTFLGRPVETIPNPIPDDFFVPPQGPRSAANVTFVGSFGWEPNIDSVEWLCREIWPLVLRSRPDARLRIVGRNMYPELQRIVEAAGGECHADVDDIRPYYWDAAVIVAPIRMGSGTRNKVLHAMASRAPVVATQAALEGIPAEDGQHLLVAEDAGGLAGAILDVLTEPSAAAARAEPAFEIAARYSATAAGDALESWWRATAGAERTPAPAPQPPRARPTASIVVCTRERPALLRRSLASVGRAAAAAPGTEIIIIEQGHPSAAAAAEDAGVTATIVGDEGSGVSRARNIGARRARGDVVLYTDDDCEVPDDWVPAHLDALADPEVVASFGEVAGLTKWGDARTDTARPPARHRHGSPPWLVGHSSNMAVRKAAFFAVGGFDERLGPGSVSRAAGEDADLIVRLLKAGGVLTSGTGDPVRHIEWRSAAEHASMVVAYEHGAGVWIGKTLRDEPRTALSFLRSRIGQLRDFAANGDRNSEAPVSTSAFAGALIRGLLTGVRMGRWRTRSTKG